METISRTLLLAGDGAAPPLPYLPVPAVVGAILALPGHSATPAEQRRVLLEEARRPAQPPHLQCFGVESDNAYPICEHAGPLLILEVTAHLLVADVPDALQSTEPKWRALVHVHI